MRTFETGATRDDDTDKIEPGGYLSPLVLKSYSEYMKRHQTQADGEQRDAGNWKKGMPQDAYFQSLVRHLLDMWLHVDGYGGQSRSTIEEACCGVLFNTMGFLHEHLKERPENTL